jgi:tetratricopeptide (TPR) repeat protein
MAICVDRTLVASNLIGIANADWGQQNLSEALKYAQQALTLNESIKPDNDLGIGTNLAILANIYHSIGDDVRALKIATEAMTIMENCVSRDSPVLATLLNNIGVIQLSLGLFTDAQLSYQQDIQDE